MSLEATLICLDNSEWMRNGDYTPNRLEAQIDAANSIIRHKTQRTDNTVGIMTYAGKTPEVLVSPTSEDSKIFASFNSIKIQGESRFENCLQIAQLVLKHRQNKHQQQRIIIFVASPIKESEEELVKLGKKLKKNNVAVDVISFGEDQRGILEPFISAVKSGDNSHLLIVPPGPHLLSEVIFTSPIIGADPATADSQFDPSLQNDDPDLLLALRISMEEEKQRREKAEQERKKNESSDVKMEDPEQKPPAETGMDLDEIELQRAIALSQGDMEAEDEEMMKKALAMSEETNENVSEFLQDSQVLASILGNLPGVDPNDPRIKNTLQNLSEQKKEGDEDKSDQKDKDKSEN